MASQGIMANQRAAGGGSSGPDISQATATPEKVWAGETFFSGAREEMQTGTLDIPAATATPADVLSGATFFAGDTTEMQTGTLALSGTATAARVLSGYTFYNTDAKTKLTGTYVAPGQKVVTGTVTIPGEGTTSVSVSITPLVVYITFSGENGTFYEMRGYDGTRISAHAWISITGISGRTISFKNTSSDDESCTYKVYGIG